MGVALVVMSPRRSQELARFVITMGFHSLKFPISLVYTGILSRKGCPRAWRGGGEGQEQSNGRGDSERSNCERPVAHDIMHVLPGVQIIACPCFLSSALSIHCSRVRGATPRRPASAFLPTTITSNHKNPAYAPGQSNEDKKVDIQDHRAPDVSCPEFFCATKTCRSREPIKKLLGEVMIQAAKLYLCSKDSDTVLLSLLRTSGSRYGVPLTRSGCRLLWSLQGYNLERCGVRLKTTSSTSGTLSLSDCMLMELNAPHAVKNTSFSFISVYGLVKVSATRRMRSIEPPALAPLKFPRGVVQGIPRLAPTPGASLDHDSVAHPSLGSSSQNRSVPYRFVYLGE